MNTKIIWWIVGVLVVVGIIVAVVLSSTSNVVTTSSSPQGSSQTSNPTNTAAKTSANSQSPSSAVVSNTMTLRSLLASGKTEKCTFIDTAGTASLQGTVYISGTKVRSDFSVSSYGTTLTHMIILGQDVYVWSAGMTKGYRATLTTASQATANPNTSGISVDKKIAYTCLPWVADPSLFVLPLSVTF